MSACSSLVDGDYDPSMDTTTIVLDMAATVKQLCLSPNLAVDSFCQWLHLELASIISKATKRIKKISTFKERVWSEFHALRSSNGFVTKWTEFLATNSLKIEPLFYQQISLNVFTELMKQEYQHQTPLPSCTDEVAVLSYEEESAVRYMGGYLIRALRKENSANSGLMLNLQDLVNDDDDTEPAESEEWTCSIDRGGLIRITEDMYQTLLSIEYITRTIYNESIVDKTDGSYLETCVENIVNASDVQFHWSHATAQMHEVLSEHILERITKKWLVIRGFSFTKSILEKYKREAKKGTQKSKPLRSTLST
ncbi:hypothetical protein SPONL_1741 [uncultured Candidatus Thioglobus sp.]|nr:hypothetical protein SPONL_1741 [uncultured Candidatus Thioglobus sp.]